MFTGTLTPRSSTPSGTYTLTVLCSNGACQSTTTVQIDRPDFPDWLTVRHSYNAATGRLDLEAYPTLDGDVIQVKIARVDGEIIEAQSASGAFRKNDIYYLPRPVTGVQPYSLGWSFLAINGQGSGIPPVPLVITFRQFLTSKTYSYVLAPTTQSSQLLWKAIARPALVGQFWQLAADGSETTTSTILTGPTTLGVGKFAQFHLQETTSAVTKRIYRGAISWSIVGSPPTGVTINSTGALFHGAYSLGTATSITVQATYGSGQLKTATVQLAARSTLNRAPVLVNHQHDVDVATADDFTYGLSEEMFYDLGDSQTLSARDASTGNALPSWVSFNPTTRTLSVPKETLQAAAVIRIICTDALGLTGNDQFLLTVNRPKIKFIARAYQNGNLIYWVRGAKLGSTSLYRVQIRTKPGAAEWSAWLTLTVSESAVTTDPLGDWYASNASLGGAGTTVQAEFRIIKADTLTLVEAQPTLHYDYVLPASSTNLTPTTLFASNS